MATLQNINRYGLLLLCTLTVFTKRAPCVFHLQRLKSLLTFGTTLQPALLIHHTKDHAPETGAIN